MKRVKLILIVIIAAFASCNKPQSKSIEMPYKIENFKSIIDGKPTGLFTMEKKKTEW